MIPAALEAEQAILGVILRLGCNDPDIRPVFGRLDACHFADPVHGGLFAAMQRAVARTGVVNPAELAAECGALLEEVGGPAYLRQLFWGTDCFGEDEIEQHRRSIVATWHMRQMLAPSIGREGA